MLQTRGNKLTWLGHSAFRITLPNGKVAVIDPWVMSNPACPEAQKKFTRLDYLLVTHGHFDHIGDAVALAREHQPQVVAIYETAAWLESKGVANTRAMNKGGTQKVGEVEVTMVNAIHSCGILDDGKILYGGEACGYVVRLPGGLTVYHAGDTAVFGDMKLIGELYSPDVACLPIGDLFSCRKPLPPPLVRLGVDGAGRSEIGANDHQGVRPVTEWRWRMVGARIPPQDEKTGHTLADLPQAVKPISVSPARDGPLP